MARISNCELASLMAFDSLSVRRKGGVPKLVFDLNGHGLSLSARNRKYQKCLEAADLIHADGQAIVVASRMLTSSPIPERTATTDFFHTASKVANDIGLNFYFLGGTEEINANCVSVMIQKYPSLRIVGRRHGYFSVDDEPAICEDINASAADVVWVGLGKPKEQEFCVRNKHRLTAAWLITCGGCFSYVTGHYPRAPLWMQKAGLEWLYRMIKNPRQLFWRYLTTSPHALFLIAKNTHSAPGCDDLKAR